MRAAWLMAERLFRRLIKLSESTSLYYQEGRLRRPSAMQSLDIMKDFQECLIRK